MLFPVGVYARNTPIIFWNHLKKYSIRHLSVWCNINWDCSSNCVVYAHSLFYRFVLLFVLKIFIATKYSVKCELEEAASAKWWGHEGKSSLVELWRWYAATYWSFFKTENNFPMKVTGTGSLRYTEEILILPFPSVMILFVDKANCTPGTHYHTKGD